MGPFNHSMDAIKSNGITRTKLWKSERNFGSPDETLEEFFFKHCLAWHRTTTVLQWLEARVNSVATYPGILIFSSTHFINCTTVFWWQHWGETFPPCDASGTCTAVPRSAWANRTSLFFFFLSFFPSFFKENKKISLSIPSSLCSFLVMQRSRGLFGRTERAIKIKLSNVSFFPKTLRFVIIGLSANHDHGGHVNGVRRGVFGGGLSNDQMSTGGCGCSSWE